MADKRADSLQKLQKEQIRYQKLLDMQEKSGKDYSVSLERQAKVVKDLGNELKQINSESQSFVAELEKGVSSISSQFGTFKELQTQAVNETKSLSNLNDAQKQIIEQILEETRSLSNLNAEDKEQIALKNEALQKQLDVAAAILGKDSEIFKILEKIKGSAQDISKLTKEEKEATDLVEEANEKLRKTFQSISESVETVILKLNSARGGMGGLLFVTGDFLGKVAETNKELGQVGEGLSGAVGSAAALSYFFKDSASTLKTLSQEMGGLEDASFATQTQVNLLANNFGISGDEAAKLTATLARLNGGSTDTAMNLADGARSFARMNNIPVSQLMGDVAASAEEFALFGKEGGKNIIEAAGYAAKLGTNMSTISGIANGLLDFETSITKELELGAMLGRNINLNRARALAYEGDIQGATQETLKQLGGIEAFNKMDVFQKRQTADLLGVSVAELQKMATNQEKANAISKMQVDNFDSLVEGSKALVAQFGPGFMKTMGTFLMLSSQANQSFQLMGKTKIGSKIGKMFGGGNVGENLDKTNNIAPKTKTKGPSGLKGLASGLKAMGNGKVLFGALNLIPTALGFVAILPAIPGMLAVGLLGGIAGAGLKALGLGLKGFGNTVSKALPQIGIGLLVLAGFGASLIPLAFAMNLAAPAFEAFGSIITSVFAGVATVITSVAAGLVSMLSVITLEKAGALMTMALAFPLLAAGVAGLGLAAALGGGSVTRFFTNLSESINTEKLNSVKGLANAFMEMGRGLSTVNTQLQTLDTDKLDKLSDFSMSMSIGGAIGAVGDAIGGVVGALSGEGSLSEYEDSMLQKMKELIDATSANKDVYLDRQKVTSLVMDTSDRSVVNKFNMNTG